MLAAELDTRIVSVGPGKYYMAIEDCIAVYTLRSENKLFGGDLLSQQAAKEYK